MTWPPPAPPTRPAWTSPSGWPPPTPPTPNGSRTWRPCASGSAASPAGHSSFLADRDTCDWRGKAAFHSENSRRTLNARGVAAGQDMFRSDL
jgi:hypothetical protein